MSSLLPHGKQHFDDNNGRPLVGGRVYYYIPNTSTPKDTWQDEAMTILNTNPIVLDARGECTAWGYGSYRQVVRDQFGNLIWDRVVTDFSSQIDGLREELASESGSDMIGFLQAGGGAVKRTLQDKERDVVSVKDYGAKGDGLTIDQTAIESAVTASILLNAYLEWPPGTYVSTSNIPDFHNARHQGTGVILRGTTNWYITPTGDQRNTQFCTGSASGGATANDGFTREHPTTIAAAWDRMRDIGSKAQDGIWQIRAFGTIGDNGLRIPDMPAFRNALEFFGDAPAEKAEPTTVWDGAAATQMYALRGDWSNPIANVYLKFKDIKFINWNKSSLAGAIVIWAPGWISQDNIWTDNCAIAGFYRQCYVRCTNGTISNASTYGISITYGSSGNVGDLNGNGVTFVNCAEAVSIGRQTNGYIQGCTFTNCGVDVSCTRNSRIRPQGNTHQGWTNTVYYLQANGVLTPDNDQGFPDTFLSTPSYATPILRCDSGSVHTSIHRIDQNVNSYNTGGSLITLSGSLTETILSAAPGAAPGDFAPARIPAFWFYSPSALLEVEIYAQFAANASGTLQLRGAGTPVLATFQVPVLAQTQSGLLRFRIYGRPTGSGSSGRYTAEWSSDRGPSFQAGATANLNSSAIRRASEETLIYRLVWVPTSVESATFADMVSYITA